MKRSQQRHKARRTLRRAQLENWRRTWCYRIDYIPVKSMVCDGLPFDMQPVEYTGNDLGCIPPGTEVTLGDSIYYMVDGSIQEVAHDPIW